MLLATEAKTSSRLGDELQVCRGPDIVLDAQSSLAGWYATYGFSVT
jgi:predicted GNAT family N-acyltransferase